MLRLLKFFKRCISFKNQTGSSLLEVMAAMAISGIVSVGILKVSENAQMSMTQVETDANLRLFINGQVRPLLAKSENCRETLNSTVIPNANLTTDIQDLIRVTDLGPPIASEVAISFLDPQDRWDAGNSRPFVANNSWSIQSMTFNGFQSSNNATDLTLGKCTITISLQRERRTATGKVFSFGPQQKNYDVELFCKTDGAATPVIENCNAISSDQNDLWEKKELTDGMWRTYVNYDNTGDDHVIIGAPVVDGATGDLDVNALPYAPLTIFERETPWYFGALRAGVRIPLDSVYTFRVGATNQAQWGMSEVGDGDFSCMNFLAYAKYDFAVYPNVKHCRNDITSLTNNEDGSVYKNTVQIEKGNIDIIYGNFVMANSTINSLGSNFIDDVSVATKISNSTILGASNTLNYFNSTIIGTGNTAAKDNSMALSDPTTDLAKTIGIIGRDNTVYGSNNFVVGDLNFIENDPSVNNDKNFIMGFQNKINPTSPAGTGSFIFGERNQVTGSQYILGSYNSANNTGDGTEKNFILGYSNSSVGYKDSFLLGKNIFASSGAATNTNQSGPFVVSASGVGPKSLSSFTPSGSTSMDFYAKHGIRFFVPHSIDSQFIEPLRIDPRGAFLHGRHYQNINNSNLVSFDSTSSMVSQMGGTIGYVPYSIMAGNTNSNIGTRFTTVGGSNHAVMGSESVSINPGKVANGIYFSKQSSITNTDPNYGYADAIFTSFGSAINNSKGHNVITNSNSCNIGWAGVPKPPHAMPSSNGIYNSEAFNMRSLAPGDGAFQDNVALNASGFIKNWQNVPPHLGTLRNAVVTYGEIKQGNDNFILGQHAPSRLEFAGANCLLNTKTNIYGLEPGEPASNAYGNTVIGGGIDNYGSNPVVTNNNLYDGASFNLLVNPHGVELGTIGGATERVIGSAVFTDGLGSAPVKLSSSANDSYKWVSRYHMGYRFHKNSAGCEFNASPCAPAQFAFLNVGGNSWSYISDINKKENFEEVLVDDFVEKFLTLSVQSWHWKSSVSDSKNIDNKKILHIGPFSEDFNNKFGHKFSDSSSIPYFRLSGINMKMAEVTAKKMQEDKVEVKTLSSRFNEVLNSLKELVVELTQLLNDIINDEKEIAELERKIAARNNTDRKNK